MKYMARIALESGLSDWPWEGSGWVMRPCKSWHGAGWGSKPAGYGQ
ncbi:MAG: hypothetical protein WD625_09145 [Balneolales bacterium]